MSLFSSLPSSYNCPFNQIHRDLPNQLSNSESQRRTSTLIDTNRSIDNSNINIVDEFVVEFSREFECKLAFYRITYVKFTHSVSSSRVRVPPRRPVKPRKRPKVHRDKLDTENHLKKKSINKRGKTQNSKRENIRWKIARKARVRRAAMSSVVC